MARALTISDAALIDLYSARRWLTQAGAGARAAGRLKRIAAAIRDLRHHPCRWPKGDAHGLRERTVEGYRIIYWVTPDTGDDSSSGDVVILRLFGPFQSRETI